ncbi:MULTISPECIES: hypothetical protein [Pseudomonas]|jgi:hypothetical protein|uniref:hypothetical protein n=1 Tax=Pseudomonas TaxID=286 RepID=UPI0012592C92|nr:MULTISPECIES: hypothetical protein [Pseudomonas]QHF39122.1 hypothetical protein PspS34_12975 [Pseudomonas sp. S34]VVO65931.1 hypothetical protein PS843_01021 [Pseudomonas fluorescens]
MTKDQERSFIARITCNGMDMTFFDQILSAGHFETGERGSPIPPNIVTTFEAYDPASRTMRPVGRRKQTAMVIHFRCYDDYYNMQILSEAYYQKYFSKNEQDILGAFPAADGDTTSFNLLDGYHRIITLDDLNASKASVYLKARNAGIIRQEIWRDPAYSRCFTDMSGDTVTFELEILERQVSSPASSTPYS